MPETAEKPGRSPETIVDGGMGGEYCRALILTELDNAAYAAGEEFAYDINEPATDLLRLVRDLRAHLERLSVTEDAVLTLKRICSCCGGSGDESCPDCQGRGYEDVP